MDQPVTVKNLTHFGDELSTELAPVPYPHPEGPKTPRGNPIPVVEPIVSPAPRAGHQAEAASQPVIDRGTERRIPARLFSGPHRFAVAAARARHCFQVSSPVDMPTNRDFQPVDTKVRRSQATATAPINCKAIVLTGAMPAAVRQHTVGDAGVDNAPVDEPSLEALFQDLSFIISGVHITQRLRMIPHGVSLSAAERVGRQRNSRHSDSMSRSVNRLNVR